MLPETEPTPAFNDRRAETLNKFGRFVKDLPFMNPISIDVDSLADINTLSTVLDALSSDDTLIMFGEHGFFVDNLKQGQPVGFERISARSGQNSRHGVFFGTLFSENYAQDIAVKVFDENQGGARSVITEVLKTNEIKKLGIKTFVPVGVASYSGDFFSFWKLEKHVSTLDSIDWRYFTGDIPGNPGMVSLLGKSAQTAAFIHAQGRAHGDFNPRNVAVDIAGTVFAIDWETAILEEIPDDDVASRYERSYLDLSSFMTGCFYDSEHFNSGIGIFRDMPNDQAIGLFHSLYLDPYIEARKKLACNRLQLEDLPELINSLDELPDMIG